MKDVSFMNITINPVEASVICPKDLAERFFRPLLSTHVGLDGSDSSMTIAPDDYLLMFVTGDSSQRSRNVVVAALEARGFELTHDSNSTVQSNTVNYSHRPPTASSDGSGSQM